MNKNNRNKLIVLAVSLVLLIGITGVSFAYWDSLQRKQTVNIDIGKGTVLSVDITSNIPNGKFLVPPDTLLGENDITEVVLTYNVKLSKPPASLPMLQVEVTNILIGGAATYSDLVDISIDKPQTVSTDISVVTVTISLVHSSGISQQAYEAIENSSITMDITFTAAL